MMMAAPGLLCIASVPEWPLGRGHLGKIDIVWPILFRPGTMLKHTTSAPCQFQVTLIKVTLIQKVKVIWGDL
jgi:hypothetical protein